MQQKDDAVDDRPDELHDEGKDDDLADEALDVRHGVAVEHLLHDGLGGISQFLLHEQNEETGDGEDADAADLDEHRHDRLPENAERGADVDDGKPGYADGRRGQKQGVHEGERLARLVRNGQTKQTRPAEDRREKTKHDDDIG